MALTQTNGYYLDVGNSTDKSLWSLTTSAVSYPYPSEVMTVDKLRAYMKQLTLPASTPGLPAPTQTKKEKEMAKTLEIFDDKAEDIKLLEEYNIIDPRGCLTDTGWDVLGKLLLADKKAEIVTKLRADKDSRKKTAK